MRVDLLTREYPPHVYGAPGSSRGADPRARADDRRARALLRRAARHPGVFGTRCPPTSPGPTPRCRRSASTSRCRRGGCGRRRRHRVRPGALAHLVRQPGRPPGGFCCTGSRTWSAPTASSRCARGRPSSSVAATRSPAGPRRPRTRARPPSSRSAAGCARTSCAPYPRSTRRWSKVVHNGIDLDQCQRPTGDEAVAAAEATVRAARHRTRPAQRRVRRRITRRRVCPTSCARSSCCPRRPGGAVRRGAGHAADHGLTVTGLVEQLRTKRSGVVWIEQMLPRDELIAVPQARTVFACPSVYEPLGIVNLEAMAVGLPVRGPPRAASRRSSTTASPAGSCPSTSSRTAPARRWTRRRSSMTSRTHSPTSWGTPPAPRSGVWASRHGSRTTSRGRRSPSAHRGLQGGVSLTGSAALA